MWSKDAYVHCIDSSLTSNNNIIVALRWTTRFDSSIDPSNRSIFAARDKCHWIGPDCTDFVRGARITRVHIGTRIATSFISDFDIADDYTAIAGTRDDLKQSEMTCNGRAYGQR